MGLVGFRACRPDRVESQSLGVQGWQSSGGACADFDDAPLCCDVNNCFYDLSGRPDARMKGLRAQPANDFQDRLAEASEYHCSNYPCAGAVVVS